MTVKEYIQKIRDPANWTDIFLAETEQIFMQHLSTVRSTLIKDGLWDQFDSARCEWKRPGQFRAIDDGKQKAAPEKVNQKKSLVL